MMRFNKFFYIMILCCSMFTGDAQYNIGAVSEENVLECPKEDEPIHMLRANDIEKLTKQKIQILDKLHNEFKQIMSVKSPIDFSQSDAKKQLSIKLVIWHFKFFIEHLLEHINLYNPNEYSTIAALGIEMKKEWANLMLNDFKNNSNKEICLVQGFSHRILRNGTLNANEKWAKFVKLFVNAIFTIDDEPIFNDDETVTILTGEEYAKYVKKCDEPEHCNKVLKNLLSPSVYKLIYRHCFSVLIVNSEEFQHFLCYHKNIDNYKNHLYFIMGRHELYALEEMFPNILHIEKISELRHLNALHDQFHYRTGTEQAIAYECRLTIRQFLDDTEFKQYEKTIRQKAEQGTKIGQHLLTKLNKVKQHALSKENVSSRTGICMLVKLRDFMREHCQRTALLREDDSDLKSIEKWKPTKCILKAEAENVFITQQFVFQQKNRIMYTERFMEVWRELVTVRGGPTRLFKFFQLSERQIELQWTYDKVYTDPKVFRSFNLLESHYIEALTTSAPAQHKAAKLAADIFIWALWLEGGVSESNKCKELDKMPRFNMGWKQNRWYYEMVYDQLFDIEKVNEEDKLEKKGQEIGILLQLSKKFVDEKLKVPDEKLKIEMRNKKHERLAINNGTWPPPVGTLDREWYEIRQKSESRKEIVGQEFEHWMQQLHFTILKDNLSKCYKFNKEFFDQSFDVQMRVAEFVGKENAMELFKIAAINFNGKLKKFDSSDDHGHDYPGSRTSSDENQIIVNEKAKSIKNDAKIEETPFDVNAAMAFVNSGDSKKSKTLKNGTKNEQKKVPKKKLHKNSPKIDSEQSSNNKNSSKDSKNDGIKQIEMPENFLISQKHLLSNSEPPHNLHNLAPNLGQKCQLSVVDVGTSLAMQNKNSIQKIIISTDKEANSSKKKRRNKSDKRKNTNENANNNLKCNETPEENIVTIVDQKEFGDQKDQKEIIDQKEFIDLNEFESIGLLDNKNGWKLFLGDEFLVKTFQKFFQNPTKSMQRIVTIGCCINEIGHRMEVINKLYPSDQKMLSVIKQLGIAPSKWIYKKIERSWQQIKNDQIENFFQHKSDQKDHHHLSTKIDQTEECSPIESDQQIVKACRENLCKLDLKILQKMLLEHLKMIIKFVDINFVNGKNIEDDENEMDFVEKQIHLRKMALSLFLKNPNFHINEPLEKNLKNSSIETEQLTPKIEYFWHDFSDEKRKSIIKSVFGDEFGLDSFNDFFNHFSMMLVQNEQNQKLHMEMSNFTKQNFTFSQVFGISLHLQEIRPFAGETFQLIGTDNTSVINSLSAFLSKKPFGLINNDQKMRIDEKIEQIGQIVKRWNNNAKLLLTGSYILGVLTKTSDIDAICLIPRLPKWSASQFFGIKKCEFLWNRRICTDKSLYCQLCLLPEVIKLNRFQNAWMPLIKFKLEIKQGIFINFDIGFTSFAPDEEIFQSNEPIKYHQSDALSQRLSQKIEELAYLRREHFVEYGAAFDKKVEQIKLDEEMLKMKLRSLSGYEVGTKILKILSSTENWETEDDKRNILKTFRILLLAVKMWAREHHIYNNKLGFFNGVSLSILVAKVMLLYPMSSVPFLIEKFFFTFSTWPWPTPVKLTDLPAESVLRWSPSEEMQKRHELYTSRGLAADLAMPIITPGHIEQNCTFNVNKSTATIIQQEMQNGLKTIRNWPNLNISQEAKFENLLKDTKFGEKYPDFIRITCKAILPSLFDDFCGYVETRIRLQLLIDVERFDHIRFAHAKQVIETEQFLEQSENSTQNEHKTVYYRKIWLVGLELDEKNVLIENGSAALAEWVQRLNSLLLHQFDTSVEMAYRLKNQLVGASLQIQLKSEYEKK